MDGLDGLDEKCTAASPAACSDSRAAFPYATAAFVTILLAVLLLLPRLWRLAGTILGWHLKWKAAGRRRLLLSIMAADEHRYQEERKKSNKVDGEAGKDGQTASGSSDEDWENIDAFPAGSAANGDKGEKDWEGIIGFFHPFCNAGGGGERVLWAAIRATQQRWPRAKCVVYTGDHDAHKDAILARVQDRFNIHLHAPTVAFLYVSTRRWVLASTWPHFTLAGQSLGSIILAWDALSLLVPDIFVDTMGYAFALGWCKFLFPDVPTGAYVHYPTISTDMLESLDPHSALGTQGVNAGQGAGARGQAKRLYWQLFARIYAAMGASVDVVMTNSTWTQGHIVKLWGPLRKDRVPAAAAASGSASTTTDIAVVYPPVAVRELEQEVEVSEASEATREKVLLYIAQFRPEKNHHLVVQAFAQFRKQHPEAADGARLVLVGSVRDDHDSKRVYQLRLLVNELHIRDAVEFELDAPWPAILRWLRRASVGVNGMWNEHFGIGVVEYQAAGLIAVAHDSGGPKLDIVTPVDGLPTGFHATTADDFADGFARALTLPDPLAWRLRARQSAKRFTEEEFAKRWVAQTERLVVLARAAEANNA